MIIALDRALSPRLIIQTFETYGVAQYASMTGPAALHITIPVSQDYGIIDNIASALRDLASMTDMHVDGTIGQWKVHTLAGAFIAILGMFPRSVTEERIMTDARW